MEGELNAPVQFPFFPFAPLFFWVLFLFILEVITLIEIGVLEYAYVKMGIHRRYVFTLLTSSAEGNHTFPWTETEAVDFELFRRRIAQDL